MDVDTSYHFGTSSINNLRGHTKKVHNPRSNELEVGFRPSQLLGRLTRTSGISPISKHFREAGPSLEGKLSGLTQVHQPTIFITGD